VRGDEARVIAAFCDWLNADGWTTQCEIDFVDVLAERDGVVMYAEAKGRTSAPGLDIDTLYGQLLRRMPAQPSDQVRFAVVVPAEHAALAMRVPPWVRERLRITVYCVSLDGTVREVHTPTSRL
jgi:hypothetical protein